MNENNLPVVEFTMWKSTGGYNIKCVCHSRGYLKIWNYIPALKLASAIIEKVYKAIENSTDL